jgi:hypothetical protein
MAMMHHEWTPRFYHVLDCSMHRRLSVFTFTFDVALPSSPIVHMYPFSLTSILSLEDPQPSFHSG